MDWINTYGPHASFISLALALGGVVIWAHKKFKEKADKAREDFAQEMVRFKLAGSTVSGRTDLGFFVQLELESLRGALAAQRFAFVICFISLLCPGVYGTLTFQKAVLISVIAERTVSIDPVDSELTLKISKDKRNELAKEGVRTLIIFGIFIISLTALILYMDGQSRLHLHLYEEFVKDIWRQPIDKRADKAC